MSSAAHPSLRVTPIRTPIVHVGDDLISVVIEAIPTLSGRINPIIAITSKVVSLSERRIIPTQGVDKKALIRQEADHFLAEADYGYMLTIKHGAIVASAGIDSSNAEGDFLILYPEDPFASARNLHGALADHYRTERFGIIMTDSRCTPMRRGVTGFSLAYWGFRGCDSKVGQPDIFGRPLSVTVIDLADGLGAAATLMMGEGNEQCPIALLEGANVTFSKDPGRDEFQLSPEQDLFRVLYSG